jgi:hypothetical protein
MVFDNGAHTMQFLIWYDSLAGLIVSQADGALDEPTIAEFARSIAFAVREYDCNLVLNDFREVKMALSTSEFHALPQMITQLFAFEGPDGHQQKRTLVVTRDLPDFSLFETVFRNHAQSVKLFRDMEKARAWLLEK